MADVEIYSANVCPYAERTRLMLIEKGVDFSLTEIDLKAKPGWFEKISPYSKVPVIKHGDEIIWESAVINEYLDEVYPEPPLMPRDATGRALARIWIDFCNTALCTTWYKVLLVQDREERAQLHEKLRDHFRLMEFEGLRKLSEGPYWFGAEVGLVDLAFYPWFERLPAFETYRGPSLPEECTRLREWDQAMQARESVQAVANPASYYIEGYARYADGTEDGVTAREMRAS